MGSQVSLSYYLDGLHRAVAERGLAYDYAFGIGINAATLQIEVLAVLLSRCLDRLDAGVDVVPNYVGTLLLTAASVDSLHTSSYSDGVKVIGSTVPPLSLYTV